MPGRLLFHILGPTLLELADREIDLGPGKQCCLLACLLLEPGRPVPVDVLIDRIWGMDPPKRARNLIATYATRLRGRLPDSVTLRYAAGGYRAEVEPDLVDLHVSRRLVIEAGKTGDPGERAALLRRALTGWQPVALAGIPGEWARRVRETLLEERTELLVRWAEAENRPGELRAVLAELRAAAEATPYHEELHAQLIRALTADGQRAAALATYQEIARRLLDDLGVEVGERLREAYARMSGRPAGPPRSVPAQLPAGVAGFTGRRAELDTLDSLGAVCVIHGTAGVGKTSLAVHWGHSARDRFPDGQLYVNLRGFDPSGPLGPGVALRGFLDALGVPAARIPAQLDDRSALYRSLLADRTVLVVLDNARSAEQVRPLLPGGGGCVVLVTSRDPLTGLVTTSQARSLRLGLLSRAESHRFLTRRLGAARVAGDPEAIAGLIDRAAGLPLALSLAAARAAADPTMPLSHLASELLSAGDDPATDLRELFAASLRTLSAPAARLFRLLGLHPVPDVSPAAASSLAGAPVSALVAELRRASLIEGEITLHDLLHAYATDLTNTAPENEGELARGRMISHYVHTAARADLLLDPARAPVPLPPPADGITVEPLADADQAMAWFRWRHQPLLTMLAEATAAGLPGAVIPLAYHLTTYLQRQGHWHDQITGQRSALAAAARLADEQAQAKALRAIARAEIQLGAYDDAHRHLGRAIGLFRRIGDRRGQANSHLDLSWLLEILDRLEPARAAAARALDLARDLDIYPYALNCLGWYESLLGDTAAALGHCTEAVSRFTAAGDRRGVAETLDSLGYIHARTDQPDEAVRDYQRAVDIYRELGDRHGQGETLDRMGDAHQAAGRLDEAREAWTQATATLAEIGHPTADAVRAKLTAA
ncbi:DNA-binding SARP family transcriptional activator [Actinoplanes tereljensis]|uniref:SARP family transcriptional regulator n=1 Tax=Paractinoplanes tereljensis TaxID=571912 RepID=A0A919NM79_9ACTN|nr:BTAD domain-containing putative transcriptional regulator [Actinoplanes tereljensis]GIF20534.1 SARP family transcriptional regulator [Actinoplanes tereljensis]